MVHVVDLRDPLRREPGDHQGSAGTDVGGVHDRTTEMVHTPDDGVVAVYLDVGDVREVIFNLRALGVRIHTEPHVVFPDQDGIFDKPGNEWLAFIEDSEGNLVGLMSREPAD